MGKKKSPSDQELIELIETYENAKSENRSLYLDGDQIAEIANWYIAQLEFPKAEEVINFGLSLHPDSTSLMLSKAAYLIDTQHFQEAKQIVEQIHENYIPEVSIAKAELWLHEGNLDKAQEEIAAIQDLSDMDILYDIIYLFLHMGYPNIAMEWLNKVQPDEYDKEDYLSLKKDCLIASKKFDEATVTCNELIDMDPYNSQYWVGLAKCYLGCLNYEKMLEACDFALAANEKCGEAYTCMGQAYFFLDKMDECITAINKAFEYDGVSTDLGYMILAMAYHNKEDWDNALDYYQKCMKAFDECPSLDVMFNIEACDNYIQALCEVKRFEEAHFICEKIEQLGATKESVCYIKGRIYLTEKRIDEAKAAFDQSIKLCPSNEQKFLIGMTYQEYHHFKEAKAHYEEIYQEDPAFPELIEKLIFISIYENDIDSFRKYNAQSDQPIDENVILDLIKFRSDPIYKSLINKLNKNSN